MNVKINIKIGGLIMKKKIRRNKIIIIFLFILGFIGLGLLSYNFILSKIHLTFETVNLQLYGNNEPDEINEEEITNQTDTDASQNSPQSSSQNKMNKNSNYNKNYVGYIEIPKINLNQGLVNLKNKNNNVNKNIQTIYPSDWPNVENGNLILASHSGNSSISDFKNLYQLTNNDIVIIYYKNIKYTYRIANIYNVPKNGQIPIYRDTQKTTITLITCTRNSNTLQTVYIGYLESKEGAS